MYLNSNERICFRDVLYQPTQINNQYKFKKNTKCFYEHFSKFIINDAGADFTFISKHMNRYL